MWLKQSWVRWDNSQPILFSPICCNWRLSQVKIISWQYLKLLLWQKIRFYNGIWLFKMYRRFQWNTNESKSISPCQICLMECQFSIATRRWTELLGPEVPVPPTVQCYSAVHSAVYLAVHLVVNSAVLLSGVTQQCYSVVNLAVHLAVHSEVHSAVHSTAQSAVQSAIHSAVPSAVQWAVLLKRYLKKITFLLM